MKNKFILTTLAVLISFPAAVSAQTPFEAYRKKAQSQFNAYRDQKRQEFEEYRRKVNEDFAAYMSKEWVWNDSCEPVEDPKQSVPQVEPVVIPDTEPVELPDLSEIDETDVVAIEVDDIFLPLPADPVPEPVIPMVYEEQTDEMAIAFDFYGAECAVRFNPSRKAALKNTWSAAVANMWRALSRKAYDNILTDCLTIRDSLKLCDWGYLKLTGAVSKAIYDSAKEANEAVVLQSFLLNQSGYKIRMGRSRDGRLHTLISTADDMYGRKYWNLDGTHYYLAQEENAPGLYLFNTRFPGEKSLRLGIYDEQNLEQNMSEQRVLRSTRYSDLEVSSEVNLNLVAFLNDYPSTYRRDMPYTQWYYYATAPMSQKVRDEFYPGLAESIKGKNTWESVNILLNFVQTAFAYKTDDAVWGYERSFFPEETLYYPYCDCEDRSIFFSRIVRDLLGLDVVLIHYPGHLATAVHFPTSAPGDKISVNGKQFTICDPTYKNASAGRTMPGMDNSKAKIVIL
ncbi:MAG: hypothetical protein IIX08_03705 [Bacteroidales bacterium]|nr:hypothetical protein [Bacteroidales bacterium]